MTRDATGPAALPSESVCSTPHHYSSTPVNDATANRGEFESIPPLRALDYEPEMWVHPGRLGI